MTFCHNFYLVINILRQIVLRLKVMTRRLCEDFTGSIASMGKFCKMLCKFNFKLIKFDNLML